MSKVYIIRCPDYSQVDEKLAELIEMMGGAEQFVKPGQRIVLKPNLLLAADQEKAVTTHPSVLAATGKIFGKTGSMVLAESPGSGYAYDKKTLEKTYQVCGMKEVATIVRKKCIRCYCCHEMCQYNAIELHKSLLYKLVNKN